MTAKKNENIARLLYIVIAGLLALIGLGIFALNQLLFFVTVPHPAEPTTGEIYVVREARRTGRYGGEPAQCSAIYAVNGKKYTKSTSCGVFGDGQKVTVLYAPDDPSEAAVDYRAFGYWFGIPGFVFGLITFLLIRNFRKKLKEAGPALPSIETAAD